MPPPRRKLTTGIDDIVEGASDNAGTAASAPVKTPPSDTVSSVKQPSVKRHHVSLYVNPKVDRAMKQVALDTGRRPHQVYLDAIRRELQNHGKDFDALMKDD